MSHRRWWLIGLFALACSTALLASEDASIADGIITPKEHRRTPDQTFLTFPEWFLVYSPTEYAQLVKDRPPSEFPFLGHIKQFWQSYRAIYTETKNKYPFNGEYHTMISVIGVSTTVEYGLRSAYETLIGRIVELTRSNCMTQEEKFGAHVAQDYVDFIRLEPWYKYDFFDKLVRLWKETSLWGPDLFRKWERKYALTTEYLGKAGYAWLIKRGAQSSFDAPVPLTAIVVDRLPGGTDNALPDTKTLQRFSDGSALVTVPRYAPFTDHAISLAKQGIGFREIAGNRIDILVTVLVPLAWQMPSDATRLLFTQAIVTQPNLKRVALVVPIKSLTIVLNQLSVPGIQIEHVYDY